MTESANPKYEPPRGVRLVDAGKALGNCATGDAAGSCFNGSNDTSCDTGNTAQAYCVSNGSNATGCDQGNDAVVKGCVQGFGVHAL